MINNPELLKELQEAMSKIVNKYKLKDTQVLICVAEDDSGEFILSGFGCSACVVDLLIGNRHQFKHVIGEIPVTEH